MDFLTGFQILAAILRLKGRLSSIDISPASMGQTISVADIVKLAEDVMSEFQSRSTWGRCSAASSAPTSCTVPDQHNWPKLRHYTECLFMRSQRDAWELVWLHIRDHRGR